MNIENIMSELAASGGELHIVQGAYYPASDEAERLGLITIEDDGGAWGVTSILRLTHKGRRQLGLPVVTPAARSSLYTRITRFLASAVKPTVG